MARSEDGKLDMAAPEPTPIYADVEERARKARVADALRTGVRLPSADMRDGEYYIVTHRAFLAVVATTRQLTANEYQFLFALMAHTNGKCPWAIVEYPNTPPNLPDWCNWLGGMAAQQVCNIRASLRDKGIITYVDNDPLKIALVTVWEQWNAAVFEPHARKQGAGRKSSRQATETPDAHSKLSNLEGENLNQVINDAKSPNLEPKLLNLDPLIKQFRPDASEAGNHQVRGGAVNKGNKLGIRREENDANASSDANAPTRRKPSSSKRQPKAETPEQKERRIAEAVYVTDLCKRQLAALKCSKSPAVGQDRSGGHWFYTAGPDGTPADPEQVITLLRTVKRSPFYDGKYLTLQAITRYWAAWQENPASVRDAISDERRKAEYARAAANGHKPQPTMQNIPSTIAFEGD